MFSLLRFFSGYTVGRFLYRLFSGKGKSNRKSKQSKKNKGLICKAYSSYNEASIKKAESDKAPLYRPSPWGGSERI
jgi:hypothetical protein